MTHAKNPSSRYARPEREQRWLLDSLPSGSSRTAEITDWYVTGTRLRVRHVNDGERVVLKLAQKVRADQADPETVSITNMYLDVGEYELVRGLPGRELRKTRWHLVHAGRRFAVDEFQDRLQGLVLAETELGLGEDRLPIPPFAATDVTAEDRFSGGALAFAQDEDIHLLFS